MGMFEFRLRNPFGSSAELQLLVSNPFSDSKSPMTQYETESVA